MTLSNKLKHSGNPSDLFLKWHEIGFIHIITKDHTLELM